MDPRARWRLDPEVTFLNHGSFGACPREVLAVQSAFRDRLETEPVRFLGRELDDLLASARTTLGAFVGADPDDLAFVPNATAGVNTVLRSLRFEPGDELLSLDHEYNAALNALRYVADRSAARVIVARLPFPLDDPGLAVETVLRAVTPRTRLALISHVTSPTAIVLPIRAIVAGLAERGVDCLVDGAHGPGMVDLHLDDLGAAYYVGNGHKWLFAPKGTGFIHVRRDRQAAIHPLAISHGANAEPAGRSRFRLEADWTGTPDPTAHLAVPAAIAFGASLRPGGWPATIAAERSLALEGRDRLCAALGIAPPVPDEMIGSMAAVPIPGPVAAPDRDPLGTRLYDRHRIEVPVVGFPVPAALDPGREAAQRLVRLSAAPYNVPGDYDRLAEALVAELEAEATVPRRGGR